MRNFSEISCGAKKIGQNSTVQLDRLDFSMSRRFAGGATLKWQPVKLKFRWNIAWFEKYTKKAINNGKKWIKLKKWVKMDQTLGLASEISCSSKKNDRKLDRTSL